jgi:hypothetical protein
MANAAPKSIETSGAPVAFPDVLFGTARLTSTSMVPRIMNLFMVSGRDA